MNNLSHDVQQEKCWGCNGTGLEQRFDDNKNRWVKTGKECYICKGKGFKKYMTFKSEYDWFERKLYLS